MSKQSGTNAMRLGNARTIADIEFVIEAATFGSEETRWRAFGAECSRNRHRFLGDTYSFAFDVVHIRKFSGKQEWHVVIISELWEFKKIKGRARGSKSIKLIKGKSTEVLGWMRRSRDLKLADPTLRSDPSEVVRRRAGKAGKQLA